MEKIRKKIIKKISELNEIKPRVYTALELHPKRQMMGRVQRREEMIYAKELQEQKVKLKKDILNIDAYLARSPGRSGEHRKNSMVLPKPTIVFGPKLRMVETRLHRQRRRGRF